MKLIDFIKNGNQLKLFFGDDACYDYWGDDWNDTPYEHNAGTVYSKFVKRIAYFNLDFEDSVVEPCSGEVNSNFCKEDMKKRIIPCIAFVRKKDIPKNELFPDSMDSVYSLKNCQTIYFGDSYESIIKKCGEPVRIQGELI